MPGAALVGAEAAAKYLRELLSRPGRYRERWMRRAEKPREGEISQAAVARVIAEHLQIQHGSSAEYRKLRNRVHRALTGQYLTTETLSLLISAFILTEEDARQLWATFVGTKPDQVDDIVGALAPPPDSAAAFHSRDVEIVSIHETHVIDSHGVPSEHRVTQQVRATIDGVSRYPVRYDTDQLEVSTGKGSSVSRVYRCSDRMYAFDVLLPRELNQGESMVVEYLVRFNFCSAPSPQFRRLAPHRIRDMTMEVRFSPPMLPKAIWWGTWHDVAPDSLPATREPVQLSEEQPSAEKKLSFAERSIVGFQWEW